MAMPTLFHHLDRLRRRRGQQLEAAGLAPVEQPHRCLWEAPAVRLLAYREPERARGALLIVPAPIKRHYLWDLHPAASVVAHARARGFAVYLSQWTEAPADFGLAEYAAAIGRCLESVSERHGRPPHLATHSLGGALCVSCAALRPDALASLVLLETPLHFAEAAGAFRPLLAVAPPAQALAAAFGCVPGSFLSAASMAASPVEFGWQRYADLTLASLDREDLRTHLLVERWALDELALPGRLFREVVEDLYRADRLMRGELVVAGVRVSPQAVGVPLAVVFNPHGRTIPPESILPFLRQAASADKLLLAYRGEVGVALQHLGSLIGRRAHAELWPVIFDWLQKPRPG